jgi:hypothetical protein
MKTKIVPTFCLVLLSLCAMAQRTTITTFRVDGLIISKARYDSLRIEREHITRIRSLPPAEAASVYGGRATAGVAEITTSKMFVVKQATGTVQSASNPQEKETMLSPITESQILRLRNVNAQTLRAEFGKENSAGGVVVYLRE